MVALTPKSIFKTSLPATLFWTGFLGCIFGLSLPSVTGLRLFLVFLSATILGSIFLALYALNRFVLMNASTQQVWVFSGANRHFPGRIFSDRKTAEQWIRKHRLNGTLTLYPVDVGAYEWAIENGLFRPRKEHEFTPEFIGGFHRATDRWNGPSGRRNAPGEGSDQEPCLEVYSMETNQVITMRQNQCVFRAAPITIPGFADHRSGDRHGG